MIPTAMVDDLHALGLDLAKLPPIEKLEPRTLRGVMKLMAKSLGVKCNDCHQEGDYAAPTRRKKIAAHMWDEFAAKLALGSSGAPDAPVFCDSCHQGRVVLLDRHDKKALSKWMDDNFVVKLNRRDGKEVECETCHVDMDMHFLAKWGQ
ncbi:MAG TPA: cytochrome c3 family protein [Polyangiaceae bacterium]|nr:cytochrome c3 family protein [Polyangiaceae bacterium]